MVRRAALALTTLTIAVVMVVFGSNGIGSAAPKLNVTAGQQWTFEVDNGGGCELFDIGAKHQWTDIHFPDDFGTYTGGGKTISLQWGDKSLSFEGHFFASANEFVGLANGNDVAQLVQGNVSTWDGVPC